MTGSGDAWRRGESRRRAVHADQAALLAIVLRRGVCDATGEPLDARNAVAMTVTVAPGVSRLAVVKGSLGGRDRSAVIGRPGR
jgi:hypothetical protein